MTCLLALTLLISLFAAGNSPALASSHGISVTIDGQNLSFDVPPTIVAGRTLVPLRAIFEALGADVTWIGETRTVVAVKGTRTIELPVGGTTATIDGAPQTLDVPAQIISGRTLVPVRFVSESLRATVDWDEAVRMVKILRPPLALSFNSNLTLPDKNPLAWVQSDKSYLEGVKVDLVGDPAKLNGLREELGHLLLAIKKAKDTEGLRNRRGFSVYPVETALRLRAMELASLARSRLILDYDGPEKRGSLSVNYPDFLKEERFQFVTGTGEPPLPGPVAQSLEALNVPDQSLQGYEVYLLPYQLYNGGFRAAAFGTAYRSVIGQPASSHALERSLAGTAAHEFGHHIDHRYLAEYQEDKAIWDQYLGIKNIPAFRDASGSSAEWKTSVSEAWAEDFRIVYGSELAAAEGMQTNYSDPRKVSGQTEVLKGLFEQVWSRVPRRPLQPALYPPVQVRVNNRSFVVTDFPYLPLEITPPAGLVRVDLTRGGRRQWVFIGPAEPGKAIKLNVPFLGGSGVYELDVSRPKDGGWLSAETVTVLAVNQASSYREPARSGLNVTQERGVFRTADPSVWLGHATLTGIVRLALTHNDQTHVLEVEIPSGADRPESIKLPLNMGDGVYDLVVKDSSGSGYTLSRILLDTPADPWEPPLTKLVDRSDPAVRVPASGFAFQGRTAKSMAAYRVLDPEGKVVSDGLMLRGSNDVFSAQIKDLPASGSGLYQIQFLESDSSAGPWIYQGATLIWVE